MKSACLYLGFFLGGGILGSSLTYFLMKKKFQGDFKTQLDEYENGIKLAYESHYDDKEIIVGDSEERVEVEKPDIFDFYKEKVSSEGYNYARESKEIVKNEIPEPKFNNPYVISPDEFGEIEEYNTTTFIFYADGVLVDEDGTIMDVEDIEDSVGEDFEDYLGEYELDSVHIRNDERKFDYEILVDLRNFWDDSTPKNVEYRHMKNNYGGSE